MGLWTLDFFRCRVAVQRNQQISFGALGDARALEQAAGFALVGARELRPEPALAQRGIQCIGVLQSDFRLGGFDLLAAPGVARPAHGTGIEAPGIELAMAGIDHDEAGGWRLEPGGKKTGSGLLRPRLRAGSPARGRLHRRLVLFTHL
jgi:hypothetical protein